MIIKYDENGLSRATFSEIKQDLISKFRTIYGSDIDVSDGTPDGIWINTIADEFNQVNELINVLFNSLSRESAVGVQLDSFASLVNVKRKSATSSSVDLTLSGIEGTIIVNGIVQDTNNITWSLPSRVVIESGAKYTAFCNVKGEIFADVGQINKIVTPVAGWESVTNEEPSNRGYEVETDAQFRYRIKNSFGTGSLTTINSIKTNLEALINVNSAIIYENDTNANKPIIEGSSTMLPPHSISCVVDGGNNEEIALTILNKKTPGTGTFGTTQVGIPTDFGETLVNFYKATSRNVYAKVVINKLDTFIPSDEELIKQVLSQSIVEVPIGEKVYSSNMIIALVKSQEIPTFNVISVKLGLTSDNVTFDDVTIEFNETSFSDESMVIVSE